MNKAEQIAPILEQAIQYRIKVYELAERIHEIIAGDWSEEDQQQADRIIENFIANTAIEISALGPGIIPSLDSPSLRCAEDLLEELAFEQKPEIEQ